VGSDTEARILDAVQALLQHGADVNAASHDGHVPLHDAAARGLVEISTVLLANGADANIQATNGETALLGAAINGHVAVVELLLQHGADPDLADMYG